MIDFDYDYEEEMEIARERENLLSNSINTFLDSVYFATESIRHQTFSPVSGLSYEEMKTLVSAIDNDTLLSLNPLLGNTIALVEVVTKAKEHGCAFSDDLIKKIEKMTEVESLEVSYRIYAYTEMKRILTEHLNHI